MNENNEVTVTITGDVYLGSERVRKLAINGGAKKLLGEFFTTIQSSDVSIINLESPLTNRDNALPKIGPNLKSPQETVKFLVDAGVDIVTLANNHIMDYGEGGLEDTLETCELNGIKSLGAGLSTNEAKKTLFLDLKEINVAVINIAENEFGTIQDQRPGAHSLNLVENYYSIKKAAAVADYVIVIVHGGHEHYAYPSPRMKETYRFFVDAGADFVVGHHPHCISGYESYNKGHIFYSLGNFVFDKRAKNEKDSWCRGALLKLTLKAKSSGFEVIPFIQNGENVGLRYLSKDEEENYESDLREINSVIKNDSLLLRKFAQFCVSKEKLYGSLLEPHSIGLLHSLRVRGMFPSVLSKRQKRLLLNLTRCESHREIIIKLLST